MSGVDYNQWSTVRPFTKQLAGQVSWVPEEDRDRLAAYLKYDQMYWNDPRQYALRVLEGEQPLYIPNARTVVDTTAHYFLKGLKLSCEDKTTQKALDEFLKREVFYSRFNTAKLAGVARGDFVFHMTANPSKADGTRISLNSVDPSSVFPIYDEHQPDKLIGCHIAVQYYVKDPTTQEEKQYIRRLTYRLVENGETRRVTRSEHIFTVEFSWYGPQAKIYKTILKEAMLDSRITAIPIYWFKNRSWDGEDFGSSELRGLEAMAAVISQGSTDVAGALSLEGLGVYATDGGRPVMEVDGQLVETEWEVAPGKVMEVPTGSYFRRVEGVGSITPATDQIKYLEDKMHEATGLTGVALGKVDAQVAKSGIALAIEFSPTLAKMETRDQAGIDILTQLFYDWKTWYQVFEKETLEGDIIPSIGDKLPMDRTAKLNELNNMMDRKVISAAYYRQEMQALGYKFPTDDVMQQQIEDDIELAKKATVVPETSNNDEDETSSEDEDTLEDKNSSNNRNRPNESKGTEAKQKTRDA